jgi:hypothetical protein
MILQRLFRSILGLLIFSAVPASADQSLRDGFRSPPREYCPETWFHLCSRNITKVGITKDLEAIKHAGLQGIHLFSKGNDNADRIWPDVKQVKTLSPEWYEAVTHAAEECRRLGLNFTLHNCPGWSQSGGPWVPVGESQRKLVQVSRSVTGGTRFKSTLKVQDSDELDYKDVCVIAYPTPKDDGVKHLVPDQIVSNNSAVSWKPIIDKAVRLKMKPSRNPEPGVEYHEHIVNKVDGEDTWVHVSFEEPVTIRSLELPPGNKLYVDKNNPVIDVNLWIETVDESGNLTFLAERQIPSTSWQDGRYSLTFALPETSTRALRVTFRGTHPLALRHLYFHGFARVDNWETKAALACRSLEQQDPPQQDPACFIKSDSILDLSEKLDSKTGTLDWDVPEGKWTVVRFGQRNMLYRNIPATSEARGWECSKMDKTALRNHLKDGMVGKLTRPDGSIGAGRLHGLLLDSWEVGVPTWTMRSEAMFEEFKARRGYELRPFMPALLGYVIDNHRHTERFLRDMRATVDDLYVDNYFGHFTDLAHEYGAISYVEGAVGEVIPGDPMRYFGVADVPMPEFWYPNPPSNPHQGRNDKPVGIGASAAHIYDKKRVAAEATTMLGTRWNEHPYTVKYLIDYNFTLGVNHLVFHSFTHNTYEDVVPGSTFGSHIGFPWVRGQTWWQHMPDFVDYLTRCQYLLQQGEFAADVLWYLGDDLVRAEPQDYWFHGENFLNPSPDDVVETKGYRFDHLNNEVLNSGRLSVTDGRVRIEDGGEYRLIRLRGSERMTSETAETLETLVKAGAVISGPKPEYSPTLMDGAKEVAELRRISDTLWGAGRSGVKQTGKGRVYWGRSFKEVMEAEKIGPDVTFPKGLNLSWIHRKIGEVDVYFLSSGSERELGVSVSFRVEDKVPGIWDPMTGEQHQAGVWKRDGGRTNVALRFDPNGSVVVVFTPKDASSPVTRIAHDGKVIVDSDHHWFDSPLSPGAVAIAYDSERDGEDRGEFLGPVRRVVAEIKEKNLTAWEAGEFVLEGEDGTIRKLEMTKPNSIALDGGWMVSFEPGWDTPGTIEMKKLKPLDEHGNKAIRYHSGTTTYRKKFELTKADQPVALDLGEVAVIAEVWCNGTKVATRWAPPFVFDLSDFVTAGKNSLVVEVTNTWRNQLIFDNTRSRDERKTWATSAPGNSREPPSRSGMVGPVRLFLGEKGPL